MLVARKISERCAAEGILWCGLALVVAALWVPPRVAESAPEAKSAGGGGAKSESNDEITLRVVDAKQYAAVIARHKNKVVLVDFWATYCGPCRQQFPHTVALSKKYRTEGLATISVCCDDSEQEREALAFLKKSNARFENLRSKFGSDEQTYTSFDIEGGALPHYKLYNRAGKLRQAFGTDPDADKQFTPEDIEAAVKKLLAEK